MNAERRRLAILISAGGLLIAATVYYYHFYPSQQKAFRDFVTEYKRAKAAGAVQFIGPESIGVGSFDVSHFVPGNYDVRRPAIIAAQRNAPDLRYLIQRTQSSDTDERYCALVILDCIVKDAVNFGPDAFRLWLRTQVRKEDLARLREALIGLKKDADQNIRLLVGRMARAIEGKPP